ncbi:MAG: universal stress protein [Salaquimonas sp.]
MFKHIMIPVDLAEKDKLKKAVKVAADLAQYYNALLTLVSVSGGLQGKVSHSNKEYGRLLSLYAGEIAQAHDIKVNSVNYSVPDPSVEVDQKLIQAIEELNIDLAVMASHQPHWVEYIVNSHGGKLARHAPISVLLVRESLKFLAHK